MSTLFGITNKLKPMLVKKDTKYQNVILWRFMCLVLLQNLHVPTISSFAINYSQLGSLMYPNGPT
jgi:hypothetical protein